MHARLKLPPLLGEKVQSIEHAGHPIKMTIWSEKVWLESELKARVAVARLLG